MDIQAATLDAANAMCDFNHVEDEEHVEILSEIPGSLNLGGLMMVFKHNPFNPLAVLVVSNCPIDENAKLIRSPLMAQRCRGAGFKYVKVRFAVYLAGLLRGVRFAERHLSWLRMGGGDYVRCIA